MDTHDLHFEVNCILQSVATCTNLTKFVVNKPCNSLHLCQTWSDFNCKMMAVSPLPPVSHSRRECITHGIHFLSGRIK